MNERLGWEYFMKNISRPPYLFTGANISQDERYRYGLFRTWDTNKALCHFIMLNPSTADALKDDATIRRCVGFAYDWGYGGLHVTNLFAYRATDPKELRFQEDPVGPGNDGIIAEMHSKAAITVCAWGAGGRLHNRGMHVRDMLPGVLYCIRMGVNNDPMHPLRQPKHYKPTIFRGEPRAT